MSRKRNKRPNVYHYHDYRKFLKEWTEFLRLEEEISLRKISTESKLAVGFLPMVLSGERNLTAEAFKKVSQQLRLDPTELDYLNQLVVLSDTENSDERVAAFEEIKKFRSYQKLNNKELEVHRYLTNWYCVAIREMVRLKDFQMDAKWIRKRLKYKVSLPEINSTLKFLQKYDYIRVDEKGKAFLPEKLVDCEHGVFKLAMSQFHEQMLSLGIKSIYETDRDKRNILSHTVAIPHERVSSVHEILNEALEKIEKIRCSGKRC